MATSARRSPLSNTCAADMLLVDPTRCSLRAAAPLARGRGGRSTLAYAPQSLFRRAREGRRAVPESHAAGARCRDVLAEPARAEGPVVTAASPTHAVRPALDAVEGRCDPALNASVGACPGLKFNVS